MSRYSIFIVVLIVFSRLGVNKANGQTNISPDFFITFPFDTVISLDTNVFYLFINEPYICNDCISLLSQEIDFKTIEIIVNTRPSTVARKFYYNKLSAKKVYFVSLEGFSLESPFLVKFEQKQIFIPYSQIFIEKRVSDEAISLLLK